jgi:peptidoglycan hydrolase-like protein with peptidoglycan-binding domain
MIPGCKSEAVAALQKKIGAPVDGKYGDGTQTALRAYQRKNGLKVASFVPISFLTGADKPKKGFPWGFAVIGALVVVGGIFYASKGRRG